MSWVASFAGSNGGGGGGGGGGEYILFPCKSLATRLRAGLHLASFPGSCRVGETLLFLCKSLGASLTCQLHFQGEWVWEVTPHFRSACQNLGRANENGVLNHVTDITWTNFSEWRPVSYACSWRNRQQEETP